jgi:hypothetical protein
MVMTAARVEVRVEARKALLQLLEPLSAFAIDAGLSVAEMCQLIREAAVKSVAMSQLEASQRINKSGIAATTGISRAEISRILKQHIAHDNRENNRRQQSTNRILARWHDKPKFTDINGQPAVLKLYGRGATFESLVRLYGRGLPTRAILDELLRARAIEVLPGQRIRANACASIRSRLSPVVVKRFGRCASDLLSAMLPRRRQSENPHFLKTATVQTTPDALPARWSDLVSRSARFLSEVRGPSAIASHKRGSRTVGVTVFCYERQGKDFQRESLVSRTNFRRGLSRRV